MKRYVHVCQVKTGWFCVCGHTLKSKRKCMFKMHIFESLTLNLHVLWNVNESCQILSIKVKMSIFQRAIDMVFYGGFIYVLLPGIQWQITLIVGQLSSSIMHKMLKPWDFVMSTVLIIFNQSKSGEYKHKKTQTNQMVNFCISLYFQWFYRFKKKTS